MFLDIERRQERPDDDFPLKIENLDAALANHFKHVFAVDGHLTRKLVSFQASKKRKYYRWYKYKEAFSFSAP